MAKKETIIKERNDIAKQLLLGGCDYTAQQAVQEANDFIKEIYGDVLDKPKVRVEVEELTKPEGVSIFTDKNGNKWVRIQIHDEDFCLAIHDFKDGEKDRFTWDEAQAAVKAHGVHLFSKKQAALVIAYKELIDSAIEEAGGEPFGNRWYWTETVAQYLSTIVWLSHGLGGRLSTYRKSGSTSARALAYPSELIS